jgi:hypothetical protein
MKLIQCPKTVLTEFDTDKSSHLMSSLYQQQKLYEKEYGPLIFMGGGITSCPLWQDVVIKLMKDDKCVLINPRRESWDNTILGKEQIEWENIHLKLANKIMFWFPQETLCPITLFELGKYLMTDKELFIGCHPGYKRKEDVLIQTNLERPDTVIHSSLEDLVESIRKTLN